MKPRFEGGTAMTDQTLYPVKVKCPHCNVYWPAYFERVSCRPEIIICETEDGGCGATFAVTAIVTVTVTPTVRKIEGLGPDIPRREEID
jgi:hypothetical protein